MLLLAQLPAHGDAVLQIEQLSKEIDTRPNSALFLKRGELHRMRGEFDAALADYDQAAHADRAMGTADLYRGKALLEAGRPEEARMALDRFLEKAPSHAEGFLVRARTFSALKQYQQAADDYRRSIELTLSPPAEHIIEHSQALVMAGKSAEALKELDAAIVRLGENPFLQSAAIEIDTKEQRYEAALIRLDRLIQVEGRNEFLLYRRAEILRLSGHEIEAQRTFQEILAAIEKTPAPLRDKATVDLEQLAKIQTRRPLRGLESP